MDGLRHLYIRIEQQQLESGDWPIFGTLVSSLLAKEEAKHERLLAKIRAAQATATSANANSDDDDVIDVEHTDVGANQSEKASDQNGAPINTDTAESPGTGTPDGPPEKAKSKGHGRNGAAAYTKALHVFHALLTGIIGSICTACGSGRMTRHRDRVTIRVIGQPMFGAELHHAEQARCKICGRVVTAAVPCGTHDGLGKAVTYDWSACAMLIVLHYFSGLPFKRLESLHKGWGIPFADSNQWEITRGSMALLSPLFKALEIFAIRNALKLLMDDTGSMILTIKRQITAELAAAKALGLSADDIRTGINASGFHIETAVATILLYYSGRHHASEMLSQLLKHRLPGSSKINKVTDGASKNFDKGLADLFIEGVCNVHAFLKFRDIKHLYPVEYALVAKAYDLIYETEKITRDRKMIAEERLAFHQLHSKPRMEEIKAMCEEKVKSRLVEPRSPLWAPIQFFINQWPRLTKFLEVPGMPLDTNLCEQSLIAPVRYLAASFNYHTENGAQVGDQAMSFVATAHANGVEPVAWLTDCLVNHVDLAKHPEKYFPWAYKERLLAQQSKPPDPLQ